MGGVSDDFTFTYYNIIIWKMLKRSTYFAPPDVDFCMFIVNERICDSLYDAPSILGSKIIVIAML